MSLATLLDRNKAFAATDAVAKNPKIPWLPSQLAYVVTCVDSRTEPAGFLGVALGDATVQRTIGGRVTPAVLRDVAYISYLTETKTPDGPWWELAVIHHTDCGSTLLADPELRRGFTARSGYTDAELAWLPAIDPPPPSAPTSTPCSPHHSYPPTSWSAATSTTPQPAPSTPSSNPPPSASTNPPSPPAPAPEWPARTPAAADPGPTAADLSSGQGHSVHDGTDAIVDYALSAPGSRTGTFADRDGEGAGNHHQP